MDKLIERWIPLPDMYLIFDNPETLKRYAAAYMRRWYPEWKPVKIRNHHVLATKRGDSDVQRSESSTKAKA